ncbi:MAG: hypothetical protein ACI9AR_000122 [Flavobacteriaceae bacterium]|jgi:uncharacterized protein YggU (UPF0235/DUF167 family)
MYLRVKVVTKAKKEYIERMSVDEYLVSVKELAERNLANKRILELLAGEIGVLPANLRIVKGHHFSSKLVEVI